MVRGTREQILAAAAARFAAVGFKGASLHDIATEVGCSKATLLYHFAGKDDLLASLVAPALTDLVRLVDRLGAIQDPDEVRLAAVDGFVDLAITWRRELAVVYGDIPELLQQPAFADVQRHFDTIGHALGGRSADPIDQLTARLVCAGVPAVIVDHVAEGSDIDMDRLRRDLITVVTRTLITRGTP